MKPSSFALHQTELASYSHSLNDDFDDEAIVHSFSLNTLIASDGCIFVNYFMSKSCENWDGDGEFEISTCNDVVVAINYITTDKIEMIESFASIVEDFINANLKAFIFENGKQLLH